MKIGFSIVVAGALLWVGAVSRAEVKIVIDRNTGGDATAGFRFKNVPAPSKNDAATKAELVLVDGRRDGNGGGLDKLHDGQVPGEEDAPAEAFFFNVGTDGGRLLIDLGTAIEIKQINSYSWHANDRGPQVYQLYASRGKQDGFNAQPKKGTDPATCGWILLAKVDTRPTTGEVGGQYGVSVSDSSGVLGPYQYLLFDVARTEARDAFGNSFFSEIDVVDRQGPEPQSVPAATVAGAAAEPRREIVEADGGKYQITIDTTETPDLTEWAHQEIAPMVREWYPKVIQLLPSEGYVAPSKFSVVFSQSMQGVAATGGTRIRCAATWFRRNLKGEATGAVFHEMVHVVQQYGRATRTPNATRPPGWLTEGLTDYLRWFWFEPQSHGAEITQRNLARARYDGSYRITANFLNWISEKKDKDFVVKLNAAIREGRYSEETWKTLAGRTVQELGADWKAELEKKLGAEAPAPNSATNTLANTLTDEERQNGWKLLFNGTDLSGWHNFKREGIRPGWQVKDGLLVCVDPKNAGDIVTVDQYDWFDLQLDYNITAAGNSGIMYHVTDAANAAWATGPEFQLEDNKEASDPVRCGWLYALYQPPLDPQTGKPLDATKPVGQWNHVRLLLSPDKCIHEINGVKYFEYVLGSDDFKERVAKSKFRQMPRFAQSPSGSVALQGDHGQISFRNIKVRPIKAAK